MKHNTIIMETITEEVREELKIDHDTYIDRETITKIWSQSNSIEDFKSELKFYLGF